MRYPILPSELLASRMPFKDGIYLVGPFASRVSFSSQQRRAISLACDIDEDLRKAGDGLGLKRKKVCVVGAGLSGLTCALAIAALGGTVYIYEKSCKADGGDWTDGVMSTARHASHRDAHPTLNFWPYEDVEPFTRLPLLNWHEDDCEGVAKQVIGDMKILMRANGLGNRIAKIWNGHLVTGIEPASSSSSNPRQWRVQRTPLPGCDPDSSQAFDAVVLATGFGLESSIAGAHTPSYWQPLDDLIPVLTRFPQAEVEHYMVSGTGDGGLVDALRLTFAGWRAGNVNEETMMALADENLRAKVSAIESAAYKTYYDRILHETTVELSRSARNEISELLWKGYHGLVASGAVSNGVIETLHLTRSKIPKVILVGRSPTPMGLNASPYHRLLTAIACHNEWVEYWQSTDTAVVGKGAQIVFDFGRGRVEAQLANLKITRLGIGSSPAREETLNNVFLVARHGPVSPLEDLCRAELPQIRRQQALYADQDHLKQSHATTIAMRFGRADPYDRDKFFDGHRVQIEAYFKERFSLTIKRVTKGGARLVLSGKLKSSRRTSIPTRLFGYEVVDHSERPPMVTLPGNGFTP